MDRTQETAATHRHKTEQKLDIFGLWSLVMGTSSHFARSQFFWLRVATLKFRKVIFFHFEHIQDVFGSWVILRNNQSRRFWNSDIIFFSHETLLNRFFSGLTKFTSHIAAAAGFKAMIDADDETDANDVTVTEATDQNQLRWKSNFFFKKTSTMPFNHCTRRWTASALTSSSSSSSSLWWSSSSVHFLLEVKTSLHKVISVHTNVPRQSLQTSLGVLALPIRL